ncbi:hypothetical protein AUJ44_03060 [Candidatus Nomurabacteria bacterium CG1_02_47_685]|uniref:Uncharacterized protein n=1 Tax=Candidatus Nomurabacteria bacterium CG1_02_47_685 TaxID=1805282 RepID=A0A1J4V4Y0_9BACT|nr:MAG: hypothetical protein AUJ44_03060 [Candidatus Nomurabacteria bacterium CG1_02_47_685]
MGKGFLHANDAVALILAKKRRENSFITHVQIQRTNASGYMYLSESYLNLFGKFLQNFNYQMKKCRRF